MFIKRNPFMLRNRSVPDVRCKREAWKKHIPESDANNLVFLDESGVNINMTRHYARSKTNERAKDSVPLNTPYNTTILSSIRLTGETTHTVYQGGTTAECFAEYLQNTLIPTLDKQAAQNQNIMRKWSLSILKMVELMKPGLSMKKKRFAISLNPVKYLEEVLSF